MKSPSNDGRKQAGGWTPRRLWPLGVIGLCFILYFIFDFDSYLTIEHLREHYARLQEMVAAHYLVSVLVFMAVYICVVGLSLPGGAVMTIGAGLLFGAFYATGYVVIAATIGATLIFLAAKTSVGDHLRERAGPWMRKLERGFEDNAWSYLLILRLVPIVPFFVANVVPAFLGVRLRPYILTTFIGIIPGTAVYAAVGAGIGQVFARGEDISVSSLMTPTIVFALFGLAALSALPIVYKKVAGKTEVRSRKNGAR
jgi:uncharacterized membrane protein YdjX (TVP38/TMEM64 family)